MPNTLRVKRGLAATLPNGASGEPLFTTDTYELYIGKGDGTNQRYQKYIASGTTSQYLRGDGSLETHNLDSLTDVVVSSPSNGQFLKYNGTNWVNSAGGFLTGGSTGAGQVGVFDSTTNIVGYTTFTYDTVTDKLSMTNGYVNNTLTIDGQLVIKSESGASAYTRGLKFPDNSYGGTGDIAGLRLHNAGGENIILELYAGNDSLDTINFAVAAGGSVYNDNVTINGNKIWNAGNLPSPLSSTGSITSGEIAIFSNSTTVYSDTALFWDNSLNRLGVGGTSPNAQVGVSTSSGVNAFGYRTSGASYYELVLAYDNTTYGHTFQANRGSSTSARNITFLNGSNTISIDESGNMGIGIVTPNASTSGPGGLGLDIYASTTAALALHNSTSGTGISAGGRIYYNSTNMTVRNLSAGNLTMTADSGNFVVITNGAENVKVEGSTGKVGIGNPASIAEMLTVNGSIQQSAVTSAITKTDANGKIVAAVAGTDYVAPSALSGYVPTSRTITINGTSYDLSANRSWSVGTVDGSGSGGRVTYWSDADTVTSDGGFIYDSSTKRLGVNTTVPNATIGATAASGYGLLIKNADSNYGGIGMSVDGTYGNLINTEKVGTAPARNLTLLNQSGYISLDESGNMGVNILTPNASTSGPGGIGVDIYSSTTAALAFHNSTSGTGSTNGGRIYYNSTNMTIRNLESGNISITADNGNFQVITLGAENIKVEGSTGKVGIGAPASIAEMLTVNGSIQQSAVTSSMLKSNASGKIIAAVSNTDFQAPITLTTTGTSGAATFNGTTLNIPQYQAAGNYITGAGNSGYLPKYTGSYTIANSLVYDNGSRVMINTTSDNTVEMLQVNGGIRGTSLRVASNFNSNTAVNVLGQIYVDNRSSQGGNRIFLTPNTTSTTPYVHFYEPFTAFNTNGGISIGTSSGITTTPTDSIMHWDANNLRVGIGTTSPSNILSIAASTNSGSGSTYPLTSISNTLSTQGDGSTTFNFAGLLVQSGNGAVQFYHSTSYATGTWEPQALLNVATNHPLIIRTNNTERLRISNTGAATFSSTINANSNLTGTRTGIFTQDSSGYGVGMGYVSGTYGYISSQSASSPLALSIDGSPKLYITTGGNVGIGSTDPSTWIDGSIGLSIYQSTTGRATLSLAGTNTSADEVLGRLLFTNTATTNTVKRLVMIDGVRGADANSGYLQFSTANSGNPSPRMTITSGGEVYIAGTTDQGAYNLQCNGTGVWGAGAYVNGSDIALKENIKPILSGLDFVSKMNPVSYNYIESYSKDRSLQTGFIAQDLLNVFEGQEWIEGIVKKGNQYYNVAYQNLIPILVKAIQEQQAQIEQLKSKLN